jgi:hypothetical protein
MIGLHGRLDQGHGETTRRCQNAGRAAANRGDRQRDETGLRLARLDYCMLHTSVAPSA